jgi:hypothetical protein
MRHQEDQGINALVLAEYQTLRAESDRISQFLANAVWAGITGFALSIVAAGTLTETGLPRARVIQAILILLLFQSMAITTMYLSELYKYKRVGVYIRTRIEDRYKHYGSNRRPLYWENWIGNRRARILHLSAIAFLQAPAVATTFLLLAEAAGNLLAGSTSFSSRISKHLIQDPSVPMFLCILLMANFALIAKLGHQLRRSRWE